ncbi:MAG: efflux RND transporter periplasmic adaptor subunit [Acidobacteriota bacterium]
MYTSLAAAALCLTVGGCAAPTAADPDAPQTEVDDSALVVVRGALDSRVLLTGELVAGDAERLLVPNANFWPVSLRWLIEDGVQVKAGDRLAEFDGSQLVSQLESLKSGVVTAVTGILSARSKAASDLDAAEFQLAQNKAAYDKAKLDVDVPEGLISGQEMAQRRLAYEKASLEWAQSRDAVTSAENTGAESIRLEEIKLRKAERALVRARESLDALTLTAPRDGIVLVTINRQEGRPFQTGDNAWPGLAVVTLPDLESLRVEAQLFDVDDGKVSVGQVVQATLDAFPDWKIDGVVRSVDAIADGIGARSTRRSFRIDIELSEIDTARMRPGMSVKVEVLGDGDDQLLLPRRAVDWSGDSPQVRLVDGGAVPVSLGACSTRHCVVESGVTEGDRLAAVDRTAEIR